MLLNPFDPSTKSMSLLLYVIICGLLLYALNLGLEVYDHARALPWPFTAEHSAEK